MSKLFLDDERNPPDISWDVVRNYCEFINYINENGMPDLISFDHDLGLGLTGYDCAKWITENELELKDFEIHSMNPVGRNNILFLLTKYKNRMRIKNEATRKEN